jgi:hypothetical protein
MNQKPAGAGFQTNGISGWHAGNCRVLPVLSLLLTIACTGRGVTPEPTPAPASNPPASAGSAQPPPPVAAPDAQLEKKLARAELQLLEKDAQLEELQLRLGDARREVVRAMAKLQSLATRAEAASGIAEAEIALQALGATSTASGVAEVTQLIKLSTAEFDKQNYGGALYLANQAKAAAVAAQGQIAGTQRDSMRAGEVPFELPLKLQTSGRANVRDGPGGNFGVLFTLGAGAPLTGYSFADQWVRITDDSGRHGWIYQGLIDRRP